MGASDRETQYRPEGYANCGPMAPLPHSARAVACAIRFETRALSGEVGAAAGEFHQVGEADDRKRRYALFAPELLGRGQFALPTFLAIEGDQHARDLGTRGADQSQRFAHRRAGRDDVVHDHYPARQRRTDQRAALAMILGFLAVVGPRNIATLLARERDRRGGGKWNALVGRTEQHVE